jgi:hypothetical protein
MNAALNESVTKFGSKKIQDIKVILLFDGVGVVGAQLFEQGVSLRVSSQ